MGAARARGWWLASVGLGLVLGAAACQAAPDFAGEKVSEDVRFAAGWVLQGFDNLGQPFAIVDKRAARIYVFDSVGHLRGASAVLLGLTAGDHSIPDSERRSPAFLGTDERTTPAGRFASEPGHNDKGEAIVWVDYSASFAIHRLRAAPLGERRAARLASPATDDKRISEGCVVVPIAFYETVISRSLGSQRGVVYVLPETRPVRTMFGAYEVSLRSP